MEYNPFSLTNKNVLITGASSGIGREIAIVLSRFGAKTVLLARDKERLASTRKALLNPDSHLVYAVDLIDYDRIPAIIKNIKLHLDGIDAVVNCAGISSTVPIRSINQKKIQNHFDINVNAGVLLTKELVSKKYNLMKEGASIVFISSVMGIVGEAGKTIYAMTKGALIAAVKSLSIELALKKIRVNAISPGVVVTPLSSSSFYSKNAERFEKIKSLHPLGLGGVDDIAYASVYLISNASKWVTGTNLIVDGGYTSR